jgi:hypothetical protein
MSAEVNLWPTDSNARVPAKNRRDNKLLKRVDSLTARLRQAEEKLSKYEPKAATEEGGQRPAES